MAWFSNTYLCLRCDRAWTDEWSSTCDDKCPSCNAAHTPIRSEDLTNRVIREHGGWRAYVAKSGIDGRPGDRPCYEATGPLFKTRVLALEFSNKQGVEEDPALEPTALEDIQGALQQLQDNEEDVFPSDAQAFNDLHERLTRVKRFIERAAA